MKFNNDSIRDLTTEARPAPGPMFFVRAGLAILFAVAGLTLHACGPTDSIDRTETADAGVTQNASAVMGPSGGPGPLAFGGTSMGSNFFCKTNTCYCDEGKMTGPIDGWNDCTDLVVSGLCGEAPDGTDKGWKVCRRGPPSPANPGCNGDPSCMIAFPSNTPGIYRTSWSAPGMPGQAGRIARIKGDRSCFVGYGGIEALQAAHMVSEPTDVNAVESEALSWTYSGQVCTLVELGARTDSYADGHYFDGTGFGTYYKKVGARMCKESAAFWADQQNRSVLGAPLASNRTPAGMQALFSRYAANLGTSAYPQFYVNDCNVNDK